LKSLDRFFIADIRRHQEVACEEIYCLKVSEQCGLSHRVSDSLRRSVAEDEEDGQTVSDAQQQHGFTGASSQTAAAAPATAAAAAPAAADEM